MLSNKLAVGTLSLGQHESHMLHQTIRSAVQHVISGVEVVHKDPETYAKSQDLSMSAGAKAMRKLCAKVPAQYTTDRSGDESVIVSDLQRLSDIGSAKQPIVSIAYESMSWSTHVSTSQSAVRVIEAVDRSNFGLCLDSFHILTKLWGSPHEVSGKYPDADANLADSLHGFKRNFPVGKLFHVQLSDGEKFDPWYLEGEAPKFTWSRHARPF
ncbi:putative Xylose isomerase-like TIM barrel domain-containing protein [Seiridium cardinale]